MEDSRTNERSSSDDRFVRSSSELRFHWMDYTRYRMIDLLADPSNISPFKAILWCFYPIVALVGLELLLRAVSDDSDDDGSDGGMMIPSMAQPT